MRLHINSEVNPYPYGHKTLAQINVLPHDPNKSFTFNGKNYQFRSNYCGTIYELQLMYVDYDAPRATEVGLPPLNTEKYLWWVNIPIDMSLPEQIRYEENIKGIKKSGKELYDDLNLKQFTKLMEENTDIAIQHCDLLP